MQSLLVPVLLGIGMWLAGPLVSHVGWPAVAGMAARFGVMHAVERMATLWWISPRLALYDWRSPDAWKWFVTSLVASNASMGVGYLVVSAMHRLS